MGGGGGGRGAKPSRNRLKIPGDSKIQSLLVSTANPHCDFSLPPQHCLVGENSSQRAIQCSVGISPPLTGIGYGAHRGYSSS